MIKGVGNKYIRLDKKDIFICAAEALAVITVLNYLFYRSLYAYIVLSFPAFLYFCKRLEKEYRKKQHLAKEEFKEMLLLSTTNQRAGYSVENSLLESYEDLKRMYGEESFTVCLIKDIAVARKNNQPIYRIFINVGRNTNIKEIEDFGLIYKISYTKSGNVANAMEKCAEQIIERFEVENEIYNEMNERIFEMKIMNLMPLAIMLYIGMMNKGYFSVMYHNIKGILCMSLCLLIYVGAYFWGNKMTSIEV